MERLTQQEMIEIRISLLVHRDHLNLQALNPIFSPIERSGFAEQAIAVDKLYRKILNMPYTLDPTPVDETDVGEADAGDPESPNYDFRHWRTN